MNAIKREREMRRRIDMGWYLLGCIGTVLCTAPLLSKSRKETIFLLMIYGIGFIYAQAYPYVKYGKNKKSDFRDKLVPLSGATGFWFRRYFLYFEVIPFSIFTTFHFFYF